jgi:hypothetical protein
MVSEFFIDLILWHYGYGVDSASNRNEYQECFLGVKAAGTKGDNLATFMCRLSWNLGASTSWNPQGLSRPVMGLLYLYLYNKFYTPTTLTTQLYFPLRFSDQHSVCVCCTPLTWCTSFSPESSLFYQPSNISLRLIIKKHHAVCTGGGVFGMSTVTYCYTVSYVVGAHVLTSAIVIWCCIFRSYRHLFCFHSSLTLNVVY